MIESLYFFLSIKKVNVSISVFDSIQNEFNLPNKIHCFFIVLYILKDNYTALHIAVESGKPAVVETLLGYGADLHVRGGKLRETPLHIASRVKDGDRCALMLLKSGAGPNLATDDGQTPVHVASRNGNVQTLILLLEDGGDAMFKSHVSNISFDIFFFNFRHFPN